MSAKADSTSGQRPAEEVRVVWGNMMSCPRVHHPLRLQGSIEGNGQIFIIVNLFYLSSTNMRINCFGSLHAIPFSLFFLLLLLCVLFLFAALISSVPGLLAIKAFDFAFVCLITLLFDRSDLVKRHSSAGPSTFLIKDPILDLLQGEICGFTRH